jgi:hypothetical protein
MPVITSRKISPAYGRAIKMGAILQAFLLVLTGLLLDGGRTFRGTGIAAIGAWSGTALIVAHRPETPTRLDLALIRFGPILWAFFTSLMTLVVWRLTGQR